VKHTNCFFELNRAGIKKQITFARIEAYPSGVVIRLRGWHEGRFAAIGFKDDDDQQFVQGDLVYRGSILPDGSRLEQTCGAVWSDVDAYGNAAYNGVLFCNPFPLVIMTKYSSDGLSRHGIVLNVVEN